MAKPHLLLLPGRALLRHGSKLDEARQGEGGEGDGWENAMVSMSEVLGGKGLRGGVQISLSHHFTSLHVVAPPPVYLAGEEMRGWLQSQLEKDYGTEAQTWQLGWEDVAPGRAVPVTSLRQVQLEALHAQLALAGLTASSIRPWFVAAWNHYGHRNLPNGPVWLAMLEPGRLLLARVIHKRLVHVGLNRMTDANIETQLAAALSRQVLCLGEGEAGKVSNEVQVIAPEYSGAMVSSKRITPSWGALL